MVLTNPRLGFLAGSFPVFFTEGAKNCNFGQIFLKGSQMAA